MSLEPRASEDTKRDRGFERCKTPLIKRAQFVRGFICKIRPVFDTKYLIDFYLVSFNNEIGQF